jgi:hypothetical protein
MADIAPPFSENSARRKVLAAENAWNSRDPEWRNRDVFLKGREEIKQFLSAKWKRELDYCLRKELWCFSDNRIAVRFEYESRDPSGQWWRSYGNEMWEFASDGRMARRYASINDAKIDEADRRVFPRHESAAP